MNHTNTPQPEDSPFVTIILGVFVLSLWGWMLWKMFNALTS